MTSYYLEKFDIGRSLFKYIQKENYTYEVSLLCFMYRSSFFCPYRIYQKYSYCSIYKIIMYIFIKPLIKIQIICTIFFFITNCPEIYCSFSLYCLYFLLQLDIRERTITLWLFRIVNRDTCESPSFNFLDFFFMHGSIE